MRISPVKRDKTIRYVMAFLYQFLNKKEPPLINAIFLQKAMFFLSRGIPIIEKKLNFKEHIYGPHSYILEEHVIGTLIKHGLLIEKIISKDKFYLLIEEGREYGKQVFCSLKSEEQRTIKWITEQLSGISLEELLVLIYYTYNNMVIHSQIKQKIDFKRIELAVTLYKKGKISLEKATEIAGKNKEELRKHLKWI